VLRHTFLHVPGVGAKRERELWRRGFPDWDAFRAHHPPGAWRDLIVGHLEGDAAARALPRREAWRLAPEYPGRTLFLDIETTGLSFSSDAITCIGVSDGTSTRAFVRGEDLDLFPTALEGVGLLVTYNGSSFDLPMLQGAFPGVDFRGFRHIDLRFPLRRLGTRGGLKGAERMLGVDRSEAILGVDGFIAVLLWQAHREGVRSALPTLIRYCLEDVVNLKPLLTLVYNRMSGELPVPIAPMGDEGRPTIPYVADGDLLRHLRLRRAWA